MRAAATDESTPPLIAASTRICDRSRSWPARPAGPGPPRRAAPRSAASTSASTLVWPNDNRSDPRALAGSAPIASSTCDGCATPAVQADPVEHSIPLASNSISSESPSQPRKVKCALPGSRAAPVAPLSTTSSMLGQHAVDQPVAQRLHAARCWPPARRSPPRRPRPSPPRRRHPVCRNGRRVPARRRAAAARSRCRGAAAAHRHRSGRRTCARPRSSPTVRWRRSRPGSAPTAWTASLCIGTSNSAATAASSAIGMMVPTSLLAHMTETSATSSWCLQRFSQRGGRRPSRPRRSAARSPRRLRARRASCTASSTAWCSTAVVTMRRRRGSASRRAQ